MNNQDSKVFWTSHFIKNDENYPSELLVRLLKGNFKNFNLNKNQKEDLVSKISNFKIMNDKEKLNNTKLSDSKLYTLKIEINKDVQLKTDNLIFIDVYKNYIIIQFLADDNGKKIYMKGNLDET